MSYNFSRELSSVVSDKNSFAANIPSYQSLGQYYNKPSCPSNSTPGTCSLQPLMVIPSWGGVGYAQPGLNTNYDNTPVTDTNYFNLNNAYPQSCKQPLYSSSYGK